MDWYLTKTLKLTSDEYKNSTCLIFHPIEKVYQNVMEAMYSGLRYHFDVPGCGIVNKSKGGLLAKFRNKFIEKQILKFASLSISKVDMSINAHNYKNDEKNFENI